MTQPSIKQSINDYFAAIQNKNSEAWLAGFAADATIHDPAGAPPHVGYEAMHQFFIAMTSAFASLEIAATDFLLQDQRAAVTWKARALGHNGRAVQAVGIDVFELNAQGKIQTVWGFWNPAALFAELNA